ncbi:MAG: hypothetical protein JO165_03715, partial [Candidatus Eremiobacteraeota bacterium]|nr:hypothetical protein [Candidatus Eremiobacteraeota bacterium]
MMTNNSLAMVPAIAGALSDLPFGACARVSTPEGKVEAFLAYAGFDASLGIARYALRILNNTFAPVRARLNVEAQGVLLPAYPIDLQVAPYGMRDELIPVRVSDTGPYD